MIVNEGSAKLEISEGKLTKKLPVFYNPIMKFNRDISVLLLNSVENKDMQIADPLAGSGIRSIRFLKELSEGKIKHIFANDIKPEYLKKNIENNDLLTDKRISIDSKDANQFLMDGLGFDYIDIDPFGSPNPFLQSAVIRLARNGILAVTATDTAALTGSSKNACLRRYWAKPLKNELMHELGIRILIRRVQLVGADNEKALIPIFSYFKDHYYRVFFRCEKGRLKADEIMKQHMFFEYDKTTLNFGATEKVAKGKDYAGPLWIGRLWDENLIEKMCQCCKKSNLKLQEFLNIINEEAKIDSIGFYDLVKLANIKKLKVRKVTDLLVHGKIAKTHFLGWGVRSKNMPKLF